MWTSYDRNAPTNELLVYFSSRMVLSHLVQRTRIITNSKPLIIDNIFSNGLGPDSSSENLTARVFNHPPQSSIPSNIFSNSPSGSKPNIYQRDWTNFDQENFILEYLTED